MADFLWPAGGDFSDVALNGLVNLYDTLELSYTSSWNALNLTLFCFVGDTTSDYAVWQDPSNPISPSGSFLLQSISSLKFGIVKYPTWCHFKLTQYGNNDVARDGGSFQLVSNPGTSTTYSSTATPTLAPATSLAAAQTAQTTPAVAAAVSTTPTSVSGPSSTYPSSVLPGTLSSSLSSVVASVPQNSSSVALSSTLSRPSSSHSSGRETTISAPTSSITLASNAIQPGNSLSTGAKAGIGIGVAVVVAVIAALCFIIFRLRKARDRSAYDGLPELKPELAANILDHRSLCPCNMQELEHINRAELSGEQRPPRTPELA